jgi:hypothetical protein
MAKECQTPGAVYKISIHTWGVSGAVVMPGDELKDITEYQAKELQQEMHDKLESILAKFFKKAETMQYGGPMFTAKPISRKEWL